MSSFRWGMIACSTPTNSQVTGWKLRQPLFSHQSRHVLFTALHSDVLLRSAGIPLHFGLSLCNLMEQIRVQYGKWKGTSIAFIWCMEGWIPSTGCMGKSALALYPFFPSYSREPTNLPGPFQYPPGLPGGFAFIGAASGVVSNSRNKIRKTWEPPFSRALYMYP